MDEKREKREQRENDVEEKHKKIKKEIVKHCLFNIRLLKIKKNYKSRKQSKGR